MNTVQDNQESRKVKNMDRISFKDFLQIMSYDVVKNQTCIEIEFCVDNCVDYQASWMGKAVDRETKDAVFWFGLTEDGLQAYEFCSFVEFANSHVFHSKSIKEIWDAVSILSIDACKTQERLPFYIEAS